MNNEPVAYINVEERKLEWAKPTAWETPTIAKMDKIPLYTHPVKELRQIKGINYYVDAPVKEPMMVLDGNRVYPAFKELTDEEIDYCWTHSHGNTDWTKKKAFARALLRKASEK